MGMDVCHGHLNMSDQSKGEAGGYKQFIVLKLILHFGSPDKKSVVALCTSYDSHFAKYHIQTVEQSPRTEIVEAIEDLVEKVSQARCDSSSKKNVHQQLIDTATTSYDVGPDRVQKTQQNSAQIDCLPAR